MPRDKECADFHGKFHLKATLDVRQRKPCILESSAADGTHLLLWRSAYYRTCKDWTNTKSLWFPQAVWPWSSHMWCDGLGSCGYAPCTCSVLPCSEELHDVLPGLPARADASKQPLSAPAVNITTHGCSVSIYKGIIIVLQSMKFLGFAISRMGLEVVPMKKYKTVNMSPRTAGLSMLLLWAATSSRLINHACLRGCRQHQCFFPLSSPACLAFIRLSFSDLIPCCCPPTPCPRTKQLTSEISNIPACLGVGHINHKLFSREARKRNLRSWRGAVSFQ